MESGTITNTITVKEAAKLKGVSRSTIYMNILRGRLHYVTDEKPKRLSYREVKKCVIMNREDFLLFCREYRNG